MLKDPSNTSSKLYIYARDQAFLKIQFFAGDRAGDLGHTKTADILYFSDKKGLIFNHTLTKSLRDGSSNLFALRRYKDPFLCPVTALEVYIRMCDLLKISIRQGYLFRPASNSGNVQPGPFDSSAAQARLTHYVQPFPQDFKDRRVTLLGLRSGCAISLALSCADLNSIMEHIGWKTTSTAEHYIKLHQVMAPDGVSQTLANISLDLCDIYQRQNTLCGFSKAFE